jgi:predicted TIM-barrel fold metal-dependent hydrolase
MSTPNPYPVIDAYCHVGVPRFGSAEDALTVLGLDDIDYAVLVLGPDVPDYATLLQALENYRDRVRGIGIPFGATPDQVRESVALQVYGGVLGLRIQEEAHLTDPVVLETLGRSGRWIYGINILRSPEITRTLLEWLEAYPDAQLAAPHFVRPQPLLDGSASDDLKRALLAHPRFYPILSRHGGNGSREPYPHADMRPWVEQVIELAGWNRLLWGSEYPVLFWRNEAIAPARDWLAALLPAADEFDVWTYLGRNAARVIFSPPRPPAEPISIPGWVDAQFNRDRTVPLFQEQGLPISMTRYHRLHHAYVEALQAQPGLSFGVFVEKLLEQQTSN